MRKKIVAANWKMNLNLDEGRQLVHAILEGMPNLGNNQEVVIAPSFLHLPELVAAIQGKSQLKAAAQNCYVHAAGAYTGEVSPTMLKHAGVSDVIIGHSERRMLFHESADLLAQKVDLAVKTGMRVLFCCGEPLDIREQGKEQSYVAQQIKDSLFSIEITDYSQIVIAYEPIWAIGTGKTASNEQAQSMHAFIRETLAETWGEPANQIPILYGGSVKPDNAASLFACPDIDGGLVGGASLKASDFLQIIAAVAG